MVRNLYYLDNRCVFYVVKHNSECQLSVKMIILKLRSTVMD
jgi:hypothetical protein